MKKRKNLSVLLSFFFITALIGSFLIPTQGSSSNFVLHTNGVLTLRHQDLTSGTATATNNSTSTTYNGTITGAKTTFAGMPAGTYTIAICGNHTQNGAYKYYNNNFYYNGGDQGSAISLNTGACEWQD
jgi:hypothetical protein